MNFFWTGTNLCLLRKFGGGFLYLSREHVAHRCYIIIKPKTQWWLTAFTLYVVYLHHHELPVLKTSISAHTNHSNYVFTVYNLSALLLATAKMWFWQNLSHRKRKSAVLFRRCAASGRYELLSVLLSKFKCRSFDGKESKRGPSLQLESLS